MSVAGAGLVDENQAFWVQLALARTPLIPRLGHIWPILLGSSLRFFLSESLRKLSLFHRHPTLTLTFRSASSQACKFGERDVGLGRNAFTKGIIMRRQLRFGTAAGSACGYFAGYASPDQSLVNIGDADFETAARPHTRQFPYQLPQSHAHASPENMACPLRPPYRFDTKVESRIQHSEKPADSVNPENALVCRQQPLAQICGAFSHSRPLVLSAAELGGAGHTQNWSAMTRGSKNPREFVRAFFGLQTKGIDVPH